MLTPMRLQAEAPFPCGFRSIAPRVRPQTRHDVAIDVREIVRDAADARLLRRNDRGIEDVAVEVQGHPCGRFVRLAPLRMADAFDLTATLEFPERRELDPRRVQLQQPLPALSRGFGALFGAVHQPLL